MINHPTAEQVQEDESTEAVRSEIEVSLEQEWEEFENYDLQTKLVRSVQKSILHYSPTTTIIII